MKRRLPNILVCGTPGCGKTTTCELFTQLDTRFQHIEVGKVVREHECHHGRNEEYDCLMLDEEKLIDTLAPMIESGGYLVDYHTVDIFPNEWFDLVIVLRCSNTSLYDRLTARNYSQIKVQENVEAEIMQVVFDDAQSTFDERKVQQRPSETLEDMEHTVDLLTQWIDTFSKE